MDDAVVISDLTVTYAEAPTLVLRDVNLRIDEGELVLVVGRTGSGKSTLLGALNGMVPHFTGGTVEGRVVVHGRDTSAHRPRDFADLVGVVGQDPLAGFVTDTVEEELAYGMEQLGLSPAVMRRRVEETLDLMGIAELRRAPLADLSGGQQQRVAIGAVLTAHPKVLVLDEPTSALDPTGAEEVLAAITRLAHDLAVTVVVAEHRVERVLQYADRVVQVADGRVTDGPPAEMMRTATIAPPVVELGRWAGWSPLPLSVRDARRAARPLRTRLDEDGETTPRSTGESSSWRAKLRAPRGRIPGRPGNSPGLIATGVVVRHGDLVAVRDVDLTLPAGEVSALMGRNGCGKSSLLWALQGSGRRDRGRVDVHGQDPGELSAAGRRSLVGLVPQTPGDLLYLPTVAQECAQADTEAGVEPGSCRSLLERMIPGVDPEAHPRDLSEGQRLGLVLAVQLTADPEVLLLDEPTRGLDYPAKAALSSVLRDLAARGRTVLLSTHDVEFVAEVADHVTVMASGEVVADGPAAQVVTGSPAFAPQVAKILGHELLTVADAVRALDG